MLFKTHLSTRLGKEEVSDGAGDMEHIMTSLVPAVSELMGKLLLSAQPCKEHHHLWGCWNTFTAV